MDQGARHARGENPHQSAAFYRDEAPAGGTLSKYAQLQGKELSYNNVADADAAWEMCAFADTCCVIVSTLIPAVWRWAIRPVAAYDRAFAHRSDFGVRRHHRLTALSMRLARGCQQAVPGSADWC